MGPWSGLRIPSLRLCWRVMWVLIQYLLISPFRTMKRSRSSRTRRLWYLDIQNNRWILFGSMHPKNLQRAQWISKTHWWCILGTTPHHKMEIVSLEETIYTIRIIFLLLWLCFLYILNLHSKVMWQWSLTPCYLRR